MMKNKGFTPAPIVKKQRLNKELVREVYPRTNCKKTKAKSQLVRGFTLIELLVVIVIIGVLVTLALTQYGPYKESTLDREAKANLRLILAAQRVYRLEEGAYYPKNSVLPVNNIGTINSDLRLLLSNPTDSAERNWNYLTTADNTVPTNQTTCVKAIRTSDLRTFSMHHTEDDPVPGGTCP